MFKLSTDHTFWRTVKVRMPTDAGIREHQFKARFKAIGQDRIDEIVNGSRQIDKELLREVFVDWQGVAIEGQEGEVDFDEEIREQLIDVGYVSSALADSYMKAMSGGLARKN